MTNPNHRSQTRVVFERGIKAHIMGIDGTWRRGCTMVDISETSVRLTVEGSLTDLNLKEFFLMLSFNGAVHRRCELHWINGSDIGAKFITHVPAEKKKPKPVAAIPNTGATPQLSDEQVEI